MDNSFATKMFADIKSKQPELFKEFYKIEPDGQTSFATLDDEGNTGLHQAAMGILPNYESMFLATIQGILNSISSGGLDSHCIFTIMNHQRISTF